jgi:2-polyprenyl-3-methyl-5-hydroxy-6-metoxy-1,4-benzoquinol methylase
VAAADRSPDREAEELTAVIRAIQERVRARHPGGAAGPFDIALPDLMAAVHTRDAALAKVAAIGGVNPRPPGLVNALVQSAKRLLARALDWHVRDQVEFNRGAMACIEALLTALDENNRALSALAGECANRIDAGHAALRDELAAGAASLNQELAETRKAMNDLARQASELKDVRKHWAEWRVEWERKLSINEVQFLRGVADLQTGFQHRVTMMENNLRELAKTQHTDFEHALDHSTQEIQKKLWADLEKVRLEYEQLIHHELRILRQRAAVSSAADARPAAPVPALPPPQLDWLLFADKFRGPEQYVRERQRFYIPFFEGCRELLDIGCGRGEFLEVMRESGVAARGIDLCEEAVAICRAKSLDAEVADLFIYLDGLADASLDGIFSAQVVEHLPPERLPEFIRLAAAKLRHGGLLAVETPNPECLAIYSSHFYLDPTHTRPIPPRLLAFYMLEAGLGGIEIRKLSPAMESMESLKELPAEFRDAFFGEMDYVAFARKVS